MQDNIVDAIRLVLIELDNQVKRSREEDMAPIVSSSDDAHWQLSDLKRRSLRTARLAGIALSLVKFHKS